MGRVDVEMTPDNLRALRLDAGLSQAQLAQMVHLSSYVRVSDWERGRHPIDPARWHLLLILLGKEKVRTPKTAKP